MIEDHHRQNFAVLQDAFAQGDAALLEAFDTQTGKVVCLIVAMGFEEGHYMPTPFAAMVMEDPFERYAPPHPDGGFVLPDGRVVDETGEKIPE